MRKLYSGLIGLLICLFPLYAVADKVQSRAQLERTMAARHSSTNIQAPYVTAQVTSGTELIQDGSFENGPAHSGTYTFTSVSAPWVFVGDPPRYWSASAPAAHTGDWAIYFDPFGPSSNTLYQSVSIPSGTAALSFWLKVGTFETTSFNVYDTFSVSIRSSSGSVLSTVAVYSNLDDVGYAYRQHSFDVSAYAGQTVRVQFDSHEDSSNPTIFMLDDVSLTYSGGGGPGPTPTPTPYPTPTPTPPSGGGITKTLYSFGAAHAAGSGGSFWQTDMTFANGTPENLTVKLFLDNAAGEETYSFVLTAGQSRTITDIVDAIGLVDGAYVLRTEVACSSCSLGLFNVTARTYAQGYGGWFGVALPNIAPFTGTRILAFQDISNSRKTFYAFGVPAGVTYYSGTGAYLGSYPMSAFTANRLTRIPLAENVSYVRVTTDENTVCYGTQVDNITQSQIVIY